jgi:mutual gliding-motility protein MglA
MVFFNYATMQMAAKIVYYGPGLCGKTTNLHHIYAKTSPQSRGEMVSLETETDRTLFFDLLPIDVGVIGGFKTRLQLYTIPGQVFYNTTRKLVLKGVDGIVFVADSQRAMLDANLESFKNLRENLSEIGLSVDELPLILQLNKRDLPSSAPVDDVLDVIDPERKYDWVEAVASRGDGVFETLKVISKLTLRTLRRRMTGEEPVKATPRRSLAGMATFRVREDVSGRTPAPPSKAATAPIPAYNPEPQTAPPLPVEADEDLSVDELSIEDEFFADAPEIPALTEPSLTEPSLTEPSLTEPSLTEPSLTEPLSPPSEPPPPEIAAPELPPPAEPQAAAPAPEPEIDFGQTEKQTRKAPEVKHVKVRSSVDIMAELESLRKRATQSAPKPTKKEFSPLDALRHPPKPKRDVHRTVTLPMAPGALAKSKHLRVAVSFENDSGVVQSQEQSIDLGETSDIQSLSVNLKFEDL